MVKKQNFRQPYLGHKHGSYTYLSLPNLCCNHCDIHIYKYRKIVSTSLSRLETHACIFRLSMKGQFDVYLLWSFGKIWFPYYKLFTPTFFSNHILIMFWVILFQIFLILCMPQFETPKLRSEKNRALQSGYFACHKKHHFSPKTGVKISPWQ